MSSHLRYVVHFNGTRFLRTFQPSEPILAATTASFMSLPRMKKNIISHSVKFSFEQGFSEGNLGEIVAAMILLFAFDGSTADCRKPAAVSMNRFFSKLLGYIFADRLEECADTDEEMAALWKTGSIFFNHFIRLQRSRTRKYFGKDSIVAALSCFPRTSAEQAF